MTSTPEEFLANLPPDRLEIINRLRDTIKCNLNPGFEEGMQYGGIGFFVPHSIFPNGYHCDPKQPLPFLCITNKKAHVALHAFGLYCMPAQKTQFEAAYEESGKKLDMGAGCIRFKKLADIDFEAIAKMVESITCEAFTAEYTMLIPVKKKK